MAIGLELTEEDPIQWISSESLIESLAAQGIDVSIRTLQRWAEKHEGTKPGFIPAYLARKHQGKLQWKPA